MNNALLIFPHQLFENHPLIEEHSHIVLIEDPHFFHTFSFHKQKLMLHRASMQAYAMLLEKRGKQIIYYEHAACKDNLHEVFHFLKKHTINHADYLML
jgi:deoxyribodipyrimidine photolyase-related protein